MRWLIDLAYTFEYLGGATEGREILEVVDSDNPLTVVQQAIRQAQLRIAKKNPGWHRTYDWDVECIRRVNPDNSQTYML